MQIFYDLCHTICSYITTDIKVASAKANIDFTYSKKGEFNSVVGLDILNSKVKGNINYVRGKTTLEKIESSLKVMDVLKIFDINISEDGSTFTVSSPIDTPITKRHYLLFSFKAKNHGSIKGGRKSWE